MNVIFMGTPEFSVRALDAIVAAGHTVIAVYSQPARPAGRGKAPRKTAVHVRADEMGLPVFTPISLRGDDAQTQFAALDADVAVVVAYGLILPQPILDAPEFGCLNIHASLLPRWRGAAPIQRAIMAGDDQTGVCIMQMDAGLDTGPVRLELTTPIYAHDTSQSLHVRLAELGAEGIVRVLDDIKEHPPRAQAAAGITYAEKIDKSEARVNWAKPAIEIDRLIRGISPFPGAWTEWQGQRLKLLRSELRDGAGQPGEVLDDRLTIAAGEGAVGLLRLQRPGKAAAEWHDVLRGFPISPGGQFN